MKWYNVLCISSQKVTRIDPQCMSNQSVQHCTDLRSMTYSSDSSDYGVNVEPHQQEEHYKTLKNKQTNNDFEIIC